jgi:hypothetical protein
MADLLPVAFHGDTLYLVEHNGEPFAPMKPIAENLGLNWEAQFSKLKTRFSATIANIAIVAEDGKQRLMVCLPLRKLAGWLYSITPAKVAPELRAKIEAYQAECDDALWRYWTEGHVCREVTPQRPPALPSRPRSEKLPKLCSFGWQGDNLGAAQMQLESAAGLLAGIGFAPDQQTRLDLLTAAHMQCQGASLFIANLYEEVRGHA